MFLGGFLLFLLIFVMAFWILIFLAGFALPYAITVWVMHKIKPMPLEDEDKS
jgi:hypothetical protein